MILLVSPKNIYATNRLRQEAKKAGAPMEVFDVAELAEKKFKVDVEKCHALFVRSPYVNQSPKYFPQIIALAKKFKAAGKKVVDTAIAKGELGEGKWEDYKKLMRAKLPIPKTLNYELGVRNYGRHPFIAKWQYGFKGQGTFLIQKKSDLGKMPAKIPKAELLIQEFIDADYEYKVITVGYKALPVVLRFAINKKTHRPDFGKYEVMRTPTTPSANAATPPFGGGERLQSSPPVKEEYPPQAGEVVKLAEHASKLLKRELSKIDILQKGKHFYILEVNRWPGLKSFEELTGYNVAKEFVKYLAK